TMRNNNVIQSQVARAEARLTSARHWLIGSLEAIPGAGAARGHLPLEERMTSRLASTFAIHTALEVVDVLYQAAGATAIFDENPFERRFRDIHSVAQQLQGRQQHFETVGQHLMGLEADTGWLERPRTSALALSDSRLRQFGHVALARVFLPVLAKAVLCRLLVPVAAQPLDIDVD